MTYGVINNNQNLYLHSLVPNNKLRQRNNSNVVDVLKSLWRELHVAYRKKYTTLGKCGCKFSPKQQQNAQLKLSASNKEEDDSRENIALPNEEEAVDKRQKDSCHCGIFLSFLAAFVFNSIQFFGNAEGQNTAFTTRTKPMKRGNYRRFEKIPPIRNGFPTKAIRKGSEPGSCQSKFSLCSSV